MKHYVVLAKCYSINEAGDEILDDVNVLDVEHSVGAALDTIDAVKSEYEDEEYNVEDSETIDDNGGIIITPKDENPGFYINVFYEEIDDAKY